MRLILSFLAIGVFGLGVLTACNSAEWKSASTSPVAPAPPTTAPPPADGVSRVTTAELKDLLDRNGVLVVHGRNEAYYNAGHIRGSKLIPEAEVTNHLSDLPKDKLIVTYCS